MLKSDRITNTLLKLYSILYDTLPTIHIIYVWRGYFNSIFTFNSFFFLHPLAYCAVYHGRTFVELYVNGKLTNKTTLNRSSQVCFEVSRQRSAWVFASHVSRFQSNNAFFSTTFSVNSWWSRVISFVYLSLILSLFFFIAWNNYNTARHFLFVIV